MFNLSSPNKKDLQELTINQALKKNPKPSTCWITPVKWGSYQPKYLQPNEALHSKPLAIPPVLPHGYQMNFHVSWEDASIDINNRMVTLCKKGILHEIYEFDNAVDTYLTTLKKNHDIRLLSYYDCSFEGHEEPKYPKELGRYAECQNTNKAIQVMKGGQIFKQLNNLHSQGGDTTFWADENNVCGVLVNGEIVSLKDSEIPLTKFSEIRIKVLHERNYKEKCFDW